MATVVALARDKRTIAADEYQAVELVDGQQRITSLVLLLKAIEQALSDSAETERRSKRDLGDLIVKGDEHSLVLLQTNHDSSNVFSNYLRTGIIDRDAVTTASDQNLVDAMAESEAFVERWLTEGKLIPLLATVRNKLSMIYHELSDESTVYRVFEVLNSRGLDVKWIDKTKSQMMASIFEYVEEGTRREGLEEMRNVWKDVYRVLGLRQNLGNEALRFAGTLASVSRPNRVLGEADASAELVARAGTSLSTIIATAEWLLKIVRLVNELNLDVRRAAVSKIAHARFLAIAIMLRGFSPDEREQLLALWEKVTFRIFGLGGADTRMKVGEYVRLAWEVAARDMPYERIRRALRHLGQDYKLDTIIEGEHYWDHCYDGWTEELRYLLFRYDEHLSKTAGENLNNTQWNKIWTADPSKSIEHIVPQSDDPTFKDHLGNLVMLPPGVNSSLQDDPPASKAAAYIECGLKETAAVGRTIIQSGGWTEADAKARAARIEAFVRIEWAD